MILLHTLLFLLTHPLFSADTPPPPFVMLPDDDSPVITSIADPRNFSLFPLCQCCGILECFGGKNPFDQTPLEKCVCCKGACTVITCQSLCCYLSVCGQPCYLLDDRNFTCGPKNSVANCQTDTETYCSCCCALCNWFDPYSSSFLQRCGQQCDSLAKCRQGEYPTSCYLGFCLHDANFQRGCNYFCIDCGEWSTFDQGEGYFGPCHICGNTKKVHNGREFSHWCVRYACLESYCITYLCAKVLCKLSL